MNNLNQLVEKEINQYKTAGTSKKENTEQKQDQDEMEQNFQKGEIVGKSCKSNKARKCWL